MITVYPASEAPKLVRKYVYNDAKVFIKARNFFQRNKDIRHHKVVVYDENEQVVCCLGFEKNKPTNWEDAESLPNVQMHLSNFWEYSLTDEDLDYSYVDRFQLFIYSEIEEYSYHTARMIRKHNPNAVIAFTDPNARLFFYGDEVLIEDSEEALFEKHPELKDLRTLRVSAEIKWDVQGVFTNRVSSYLVMTSLYWIKREFYYGPLNEDKTFYLIKQPVKENGLTALINNVIGTKQMIRKLRPDFIPVVDLGVSGDPNQFAGTSGEDVWSMFFEQISDYSLKEVYNSQSVVLDQNSNLNLNPYFTEFTFSNQRAELKYGDDLRYNETVTNHTNAVLDQVFPKDAQRVLAVIVRGTDYLAPKVANYVPHGITAEETLEKAIAYVKEKDFDYVYLCTEDQSYLDLFLASELKDKLIYVDQQRIDYQTEQHQNKLLIEIFGEERSNPYTRTLDYIAVLEGLTKCKALLANVSCGAVTYALGRGTDYEFVDVSKIQAGLSQ